MNDPFAGTWVLKPEKSQFDPNHRPTAGTMVFEIEPGGAYILKAEGIDAKGQRCAERPARIVPDGEHHPVPDFPGLSVVARRSDPKTLRTEARREDGSVVGGGCYAVSEDGRSLTATTFGYDTQLRQFQTQTVWERQ
jgi:hypothetical protein